MINTKQNGQKLNNWRIIMKINRATLAAALLCFVFAGPSFAQQAVVVSSCGSVSPNLNPADISLVTMDPTGKLCTSGAGGSGGATTIANGADTAEGSTTDAPAAVPTSSAAATTISLLKAFTNLVGSSIPTGAFTIGGTFIVPPTATRASGQATIATGGTAIKIITAAQNVHGYCLQVPPGGSNTDPTYFSDATTTPSATNGFELDPSAAAKGGGSWCTPSNWPAAADVWWVGATAGDKVNWQAN